MAAKHTPGPWILGSGAGTSANLFTIHGDARGKERIIAYTKPSIKVDKSSHVVPVDPTEEDWANGKLMAAAPDLLEAAQWVLALIEGGEEMPKPTDPAAQLLAYAVAKAEGKGVSSE